MTAKTEHLIDPVPERYEGVWVRTLLETPKGRDTTTWVRWLQTSQWHADLRVPAGLGRGNSAGLAQQQGFFGITQITPSQSDTPDICTWQRLHDFQPPRSTPDAGTMVFESADRVIERGVHGNYLEVWERLPSSLGQRLVLQRMNDLGLPTSEHLLQAGDLLMHVRPRSALWPEDLKQDETLADVIQRHVAHAPALLDFEISFGKLAAGQCLLERSTLPALEGTQMSFEPQRRGEHTAHIAQGPMSGDWHVQEWLATN